MLKNIITTIDSKVKDLSVKIKEIECKPLDTVDFVNNNLKDFSTIISQINFIIKVVKNVGIVAESFEQLMKY